MQADPYWYLTLARDMSGGVLYIMRPSPPPVRPYDWERDGA
jgi:hypothetical protein